MTLAALKTSTHLSQFVPSAQQEAYFHWIITGTGSAIVRARAGCGKTKSIIEGLRFMEGTIYLGAFNKSIAVEISEKIAEEGLARRGLFVGTMHSAGYSTWRRVAPNVRVDENKTRTLIDAAIQRDEVEDWQTPFINKLVSLAKQLLLPFDNRDPWMDAVDHYGLDSELPEDADVLDCVRKARDIHALGRSMCHEVIDFDDMIYAPLTHRARFFPNDWVIIDEAQDTNPARRMLAAKMLKPGTGRLVAVGDDRQAIYGFTGASANSLELIAEEHKAVILPLTVTYRCPKNVVNFAHQWVDDIEAHESAPEGTVREAVATPEGLPVQPWYVADKPGADDMVLCRFTRPLIQTAYGMLKVGHACKVEGRDIGNGLVTLARRWKVKTLDALEARLDKYLDREVRKARAKRSETAEQTANDKVETLLIFIQRCRETGGNTIDCVVSEIQSLFSDDVKGVTTLCSIHRAKGRERRVVYWIQSSHKGDLKPWEQVQEDNLNYVATTRAQHTLVLVPE